MLFYTLLVVPCQVGALEGAWDCAEVSCLGDCSQTAIVPVNFEGDECKSSPVAVIPESHLDPATKIRFNDGKVDPQGRLWAGSMAMDASRNPNSATKGYLYCLQRGASLKGSDDPSSPSYELVQKLDQVGISNGTDWYGDLMYYIDTLKAVCYA